MRPVLVPFSLALLFTAAAAGEPTPSPALVVLNKADNAMAIINPANGKLVATVPVGRNPHEAAISDDGKFAFSSNMQGNSISVIDMTTQKGTAPDRLPGPPHATRPIFCSGEVVFYGRGQQLDWPIRSVYGPYRLDARLWPERYSHAGRDQGFEQDLHLEHGLGQREHVRARVGASRNTSSGSSRLARIPRQLPCLPTASRCGRRRLATVTWR